MYSKILQARVDFLNSPWGLDEKWYVKRCPAQDDSNRTALQHYLDVGCYAGIAPNEYLDSIQNATAAGTRPIVRPWVTDGSHLELEMSLVEASGMFDASYYLDNNPELVSPEIDPLRHFCSEGWRALRNPHPEFDVWWYWSCYLDPTREALNPVVHHALIGRYAGCLTTPPRYRLRDGFQLDPDRKPRRICLFAGHDPDGEVDDYVIRLVRELGKFCDVYYLADCFMDAAELAKIRPYVRECWSYRHGRYDFGSWAQLAGRHVGWDRISTYDELLLVNDSAYLVGDLQAVFDKMDRRRCDWWGLQATKGMFDTRSSRSNAFTKPIPMHEVRAGILNTFHNDYVYDFHVGSYFIAFRAPVVADAGFRFRISGAPAAATKGQVVRKSEIGLTQYLVGRRFHFDTFMPDLFPLHPLFTSRHFELIFKGFPLFKRLLLASNHYNAPGLVNWEALLSSSAPNAPIDEIKSNLHRVANHARLTRSFTVAGDATGIPKPRDLMTVDRFREQDALVSKCAKLWVFPVDRFTGVMGGNERAVFELVRNDPGIKKIVLTRWRRVCISGSNVVVVPLRSPEGEGYVLRAGLIFVGNRLQRDLIYPIDQASRSVIRLGVPPSSFPVGNYIGNGRSGGTKGMSRDKLGAGGNLLQLDILSLHFSWVPEDLQREWGRLTRLRSDRRLIMFVFTSKVSLVQALEKFPANEMCIFQKWLDDQKLCVGIRGAEGADVSGILEAFRGVGAFACSARSFPHVEILYRASCCVVAEALDSVSGCERPVVHFSPRWRSALRCPGEPAPKAGELGSGRSRSFRELIASLKHLIEDPGGEREGVDVQSGAAPDGMALYSNTRTALSLRRVAF